MDLALIVGIAVVAVLIVLLALYLWASRNSLVTLQHRVDEAWAEITVQLRRRAAVVPGLVETVHGYADHEQRVYDAATAACRQTLEATSPAQATAAENRMQQALRGVFGVAESFPKLQSSQHFLTMQAELVDAQEHLQASRRFYNGGVREFNTKIRVFPNTIVARRLGYTTREFFEVADSASIAEPPRVQF